MLKLTYRFWPIVVSCAVVPVYYGELCRGSGLLWWAVPWFGSIVVSWAMVMVYYGELGCVSGLLGWAGSWFWSYMVSWAVVMVYYDEMCRVFSVKSLRRLINIYLLRCLYVYLMTWQVVDMNRMKVDLPRDPVSTNIYVDSMDHCLLCYGELGRGSGLSLICYSINLGRKYQQSVSIYNLNVHYIHNTYLNLGYQYII